MRLLFAESAFNDLADIQAYYLEQDIPNIGDKFVTEIIAHAEVLEDHPEIGRIVPEFDEPKIRELIHPPFRIVYWLDNQTIHVIRIWRSERLLQLPVPN
ncbi:MAG TPA: type II toxin-antitoxin system RelE/ParE family toxin [Methylobacter sp.]|jgi:plasmid stabilization system protein ParE